MANTMTVEEVQLVMVIWSMVMMGCRIMNMSNDSPSPEYVQELLG